jgi:hypothetical protein
MVKKLLIGCFCLFGFILYPFGAFPQEELKGPFKVEGELLVTKKGRFILSKELKVKTPEGKGLDITSLQAARLIKIYLDHQGRIREVIILGWEI